MRGKRLECAEVVLKTCRNVRTFLKTVYYKKKNVSIRNQTGGSKRRQRETFDILQ